MKHLLEILKIVDGAVKRDYPKVLSYAQLLAEKLRDEGEISAANKISAVLTKSNAVKLTAARGTDRSIPSDSESKLALAEREFVNRGDVELVLPEASKLKLDKFLAFIKASNQLESSGVNFVPSLLLYGPPGCGKTQMAKYIAGEVGLPLLTARIDSVVSSYLGSTAKNLRALFEFANSTPCVLFLDEFDAIAKVRDDSHELGELKRVVVSLLQNIDRLDNGTILLAATNHEHLLDSAVWRRFSYKMELPKPSLESRVTLFAKYLSKFGDQSDFQMYGEVSEGLSGADIEELSTDLKRACVLKNIKKIRYEEFMKTLAEEYLLKGNIAQKDTKMQMKYLREKFPKAFPYDTLNYIFGISKGKISKLLST